MSKLQKEMFPFSETTVRTGQYFVIHCYWKNWRCLTRLITCHRGRYLFHICIVRKEINILYMHVLNGDKRSSGTCSEHVHEEDDDNDDDDDHDDDDDNDDDYDDDD